MNWRDVYSPADLGYDDEPDAPDGRCHGAAIPGAGGCGRFVSGDAYMCPACKAESDEYWHDEAARDAQLDAEFAGRQSAALTYTDPTLPALDEEADNLDFTNAVLRSAREGLITSLEAAELLGLDDLPF